MPKRYQGNIITSTPTDPAGPYENSAAPGVWSLAEANEYTAAGLWPTAGNTVPNAGFVGDENTTAIDKIIISTLGNATDFGDTYITHSYTAAAVSSATRGVIAGGSNGLANITYFDQTTSGSTGDFGDLTGPRLEMGSASNGTRGVWYQGENPSSGSKVNIIDYVTIASVGNATDFGDGVAAADYNPSGMCNSTTRGVFGGYNDGSYNNTISYITIATTGNGQDFGDLTNLRAIIGTHSSSTRGLFLGGGAFPSPPGAGTANTIDYVTIASTGNATDFGDCVTASYYKSGTGDKERCLIVGNENNSIEYITIASTGNAADFGDLNFGNERFWTTSNSHGGLAA